MIVQPMFDKVLVKPDPVETMTAGGIVIAETVAKKPIRGTIVSVGQGALSKKGNRIPLTLKGGEKVIYDHFAGTDVKIDGERHIIMREEYIMCTLEGDGEVSVGETHSKQAEATEDVGEES